MKAANTSLFSNLFGARSKPAEILQPSQNVVTTVYSQPHVLQQKMAAEKLSHGETVVASLSPVRLDRDVEGMVLYFCPMRTIDVATTITCGDGGSIPGQVKVEGLQVPADCRSGYYTLKNVVLTSNGSIQVKATESTVWEKA